MFYDEVNVTLKAGKGGDGCFSFRRAKYEAKWGPDGGDGGRGGNVYIVGDTNVADLTDFHFKPGWQAKNGEPGRGSDQHGAKGEHLTLKLPIGTIVVDRETGDPVAEVTEHGEQVLLLEGGEGGKGNAQFKSSTNQAPRQITLADIPGLIEGASENKGLGHRFLKHVERCKVLLVMLDMQGTDGREPLADYRVLQSELKLYLPGLVRKPILVCANKMDEPDAPKNLAAFRKKVKETVYPVSCVSDEGFEALKQALLREVLEMRRLEQEES